MTVEEKAKELVDKFTFNCRECDNAKQYALIAVDEIIKSSTYPIGYSLIHFEAMKFWEEVKKELEKL